MSLNVTETIILPCETKSREFDAKLLLACFIAEKGLKVIVGAKKVIDGLALSLPKGIYIGKSLTTKSATVLSMFRRLGYTVVAWDEEGLVWATPELYQLTKLDSSALKELEGLFAWGEANASAIRAHPGFSNIPIYLTGNPRTDLLRPKLRGLFAREVEQLNRRYGRFILINTNFSRVNHYYANESHLLNQLKGSEAENLIGNGLKIGLARHKKQLFDHFIEAVPRLADRFPETNIIVRPHPSENHHAWHEAASHKQNVKIIYEGNVVPWLMAAEAVIHNSCTTGVESFLLDKMVFAYCPVKSDAFDHALPNGLSIQCTSLQQLVEKVADSLRETPPTNAINQVQYHDLVKRHLASFESEFASERIAQILQELCRKPRRQISALSRMVGVGTACWRSFVKKRIERVIPNHRNNKNYLNHLFPMTSLEEVENKVNQMSLLLDRFQRLHVNSIAENVFQIETKY